MMLKASALRLSALLAVYSAACSSSDYTYGYSANAAAGGTNWTMSEPLLGVAPVPGVDVTGVIYRYTAVKDRPDDFTVAIQNENAVNGGYIFREVDDWSGRSGETISKAIPVNYSPIRYWGAGSIETTGVGSVEDPQVVYTYRVDTCYDPQSDPNCPGYEAPPVPEPVAVAEEPEPVEVAAPAYDVYDAYRDEIVQQATAPTDRKLYDDDDLDQKDSEEEEKESMEKALAANDNALTIANEMSQNAMLRAMNPVTMSNYYAATIPGGTYQETVILVDSKLPDNKRAFRNMANDKLHTKMVEEQYR